MSEDHIILLIDKIFVHINFLLKLSIYESIYLSLVYNFSRRIIFYNVRIDVVVVVTPILLTAQYNSFNYIECIKLNCLLDYTDLFKH